MNVRLTVAASAFLAALAGGAAPAAAESGRMVDSSLGLTTRAPSSPSGLALHAFFRKADDPNAKPPPLRSAVVHAPTGLRFDTRTVEECTASDDQLRALGSNACPAKTRLTVGSFSAITGFGPPADPFEGDDHVFNGPNQLVEVITFKGSSASPAFDRLTISGSTLTAHPPMAPGGPPDGEVAVRSLDFRIPVRGAGGRSLITTPPDCPADGQWTTTATFRFGDGSSDSVTSRTPCDRGLPQPGLRLSVRPRRVRAGHRVRVRFRVSSTATRCVSGAHVRLGRRSARTDRRGRAVMTLRFGRRGARRVRATSPDCRPASALVRVLAHRQRAR
jgi:hypothetical protein